MPIPIPKKLSQLFKLRVIAAVDEDGRELSLCISDPVYDPNDSGKLIGGVFSFKKAGILLGAVTDYYRGDGTWQPMNKAAVGLSNVDNTPDLNKPISVDQAAADLATLNSAKTYADVGDLATLNSAKAYTDAMTTGLLQFIGNWSASGGLYPTTGGSGAAGAVVIGDVWRVSAAGTIGGVNYRIGDSFYATSNTPAQDPTKWASILLELGYNPEDVANKVTAFSSPTNAQYPSALLVKTQLDLKLNDVTNGTAAAGAIPLVDGSGTSRTIARVKPTNADVVITAGATPVDPVSIGLLGTTLKYWEEVSTAIDSVTQRLTWRPKDPNGAFVRANTVQVIATPRGLTLRDPLESGSTFPTGFTTGLDLQIKGTTGTSTNYAQGGYCFGENNRAGVNCIAVGTGNRADSGFSIGSLAIGTSNTAAGANIGYPQGLAVGFSNTGGNGTTFGRNNNSSGIGNVIIGEQIVAVSSAFSAAVGHNSTISVGNAGYTSKYSFGSNHAMTAAGRSMIVAQPLTDSVSITDQGIVGFMRSGLYASIPLARTITGVTDWTNTAWRSVSGAFLIPETLGGFTPKMRFNFIFSMQDGGGTGSPVLPNRIGVMLLEVWNISGTPIPTVKVLQGGDANLLTYFDFRIVYTGGQAKLEWAIIADPSSGAAATRTGTFTISGECSMLNFF